MELDQTEYCDIAKGWGQVEGEGKEEEKID